MISGGKETVFLQKLKCSVETLSGTEAGAHSEGKDLSTTCSMGNQSYHHIWLGTGARTECREARNRSSDIFPGRWI